MTPRTSHGRVLFPLLALALLIPAASARAGTVPVTSSADSGPGSLRAAVAAANPGDTVAVPPMTITLSSGQIVVDKNLTIAGAGAPSTVVSGNHGSRVFIVTAGTVTISGMTITAGTGKATSAGTGGDGGAVLQNAGATDHLTVSDVALTHSDASNDSDGGGIATDGGILTVQRSLITGNQAASRGGGLSGEGDGLTLVDSTVTGNSMSVAGQRGGGVYLNGSGLNQLTNDTITHNDAGAGGDGGGIDFNALATTVVNTIIAANTASSGSENCLFTASTSGGHNLQDRADQCGLHTATDKLSTDPKLAPLAANGGPTATQALLAGSPAIDAGDNAACPAVDQRGVARPQEGVCDIGAYEFQETADLAATLTPSASTVTVGGKLTLTATVTNLGPFPASAATLADTLPAGLTLLSATPSQGTCTGSPAVSCALGTVAPGASATVALAVSATAAGSLTDSVTATTTRLDPVAANDTASTTIRSNALLSPRLSALRAKPSHFVLGSRKARISRRTGTTISFKLDRAAKVKLTFVHVVGKRRRTAGTLSFAGHAGLDKVRFSGRLARGRLRPGRYVLTAVATDSAGLRSAKRSIRLTARR